jgi:hypothetical protein
VPFQPALEILHADLMFNPRLLGHYRNRCRPFPDIIDPFVLAKYPQPLCHRFIERSGGHFNRMLDPFPVAARDGAGAKGHN